MKTIFDMIQHFSSLFITFNTVMTGFEDLRQVARIARSEGWALDILIRRRACYRKTSGIVMPLVFLVVRILQKLWGRPPGLRGSPWTRSSQRDQSHPNGKAGQGAVRGPGVRPTIFADRPVMGKTSGIGLTACATW